ncbi:MAG: 50S ribosomal protein L9 [Cyclobacteriaceae bacterium]
MEIILKEHVAGLGYKNDLVNVKPGYGRNYLIPQGVAILANSTNKKVHAEDLKQAAHKAEKLKTDAQALATKLETVGAVDIATKVGDNGRIFGAITALQVSDALKNKGYEVDRRRISLKDKNIKEIGEYEAVLDLHKEIRPTITIKIVSE